MPGANDAAGAGGMAIFFTLSGFLITRFLWERPRAKPFLIRRVMRILPLAWLAMLILFFAEGANRSVTELLANALFYMNFPPLLLMEGSAHLRILAKEMQFYFVVALIAAVGGDKGLYFLPVLGLASTFARITARSIITWHRIDEILAGSTLALLYLGAFEQRAVGGFKSLNFYAVASVAVVCTYFLHSPPAYARPYAVDAMVGVTLWSAPIWLEHIFYSRPAAYIAKIFYALYVCHAMLQISWLGSGDKLEKYIKRTLLFAATWSAAHMSTYIWEQRFIRLAKVWTTKRR